MMGIDRDCRYGMLGGSRVWEQLRCLIRRRMIWEKYDSDVVELLATAQKEGSGRVLREGMLPDEDYDDVSHRHELELEGRKKMGALMYRWQVIHRGDFGVSQNSLGKHFKVGQKHLPRICEEWSVLEWHEVAEDGAKALARLVYERECDLGTSWEIWKLITGYDLGPPQ